MTIGKKIKMFRERLGLTQQALGHMVHVSENAIGNYEAGRRNPSVELLKEIAEALKVDLLDFFEEEKKTLLQFPMDYKKFMQWLEIKQLVHGFGWFTSEKFEYEMRSDRYFVELKRDYLIWLKDGFYFVPLKSEWVDSEMNDDVIDVEGVCKVLKRDIPDLEREARKGTLITYDETLFAEQVYASKFDYQPIETERRWKDYDTFSWAAVTHDNIIAYIHEQKACFVHSEEGILKLPIYEGVYEYFGEKGIDLEQGIFEEDDIGLDDEEKQMLTEKDIKNLQLFMAKEELFIKELMNLLQKETSPDEKEQDLTFTKIEESIEKLTQQEVFHENDYDTIAHFLRCRIGSLDNLKRLMKKRKTKEVCIFPDEWEEEKEIKTEIKAEKRLQYATTRDKHDKNYQFLLVEDAVFMQAILSNMLERAFECYIDTAKDGQEAVNLYQSSTKDKKPYDLVLLDITLPGMDGVEALEEIMKIHPEATVVMCSSLTGEKTVVECIQKGAKHFIGKPFVENKVIETVQNVLSNNEKSSK